VRALKQPAHHPFPFYRHFPIYANRCFTRDVLSGSASSFFLVLLSLKIKMPKIKCVVFCFFAQNVIASFRQGECMRQDKSCSVRKMQFLSRHAMHDVRSSVCLSVCLSVTLVDCDNLQCNKTCKWARMTAGWVGVMTIPACH